MFAGRYGVVLSRKSKSTSIVSNVFKGSSIEMVNGAQPLIQSNQLHLSHILVTSSTPNIIENIFSGEDLPVKDKWAGIKYEEGGSGLCENNSFNNFRNPYQSPIIILPASGPRLRGNKFTDCVESNTDYASGICSSEEEAKLIEIIGKQYGKSNLKQCCNCEKFLPCGLCKECKHVYYCGEECQKQDWAEHQEFCAAVSRMKNRCPIGCQCCIMD